jgi:DNA modification methylase
MNGWKRGKDYAMVVTTIYRLPHRTSQIYSQASTSNVCIFTYSHLALLLSYSQVEGQAKAQQLLKKIFQTVQALNPSKNAIDYWLAINKTILSFSKAILPLWEIEKGVATESIAVAKEEALTFLAKEREKIMRMTHKEALKELIKVHKIESKIKTINAIADNGLFTTKINKMKIDNYINQIIEGNCVEVMRKFDDNVIDLTVTSPPYDNLRNYKGFEFPFEDIAKELFRVTKQGGVVVWVVNDATIEGSETGTSFQQALYFREIGFNLHDTMIFRKTNPIPQIYRKRYNNEFEFMFVFSKGTVKTHNPLMVDCLHAGLELNGTTYKNFSKNEQTREKMAKPVKDKKIKGNIWEYVVGKKQEDQEAKGHPAPFPCELVRDHIKSWTNQGDIVFDPMSGSGTVARVAAEMGRQYIGVDISHEYCDIARKRVKLIENAPTLFVVEEPEIEYNETTEKEAQPLTGVLQNGGFSAKLNGSASIKH